MIRGQRNPLSLPPSLSHKVFTAVSSDTKVVVFLFLGVFVWYDAYPVSCRVEVYLDFGAAYRKTKNIE
jgi:hypothetical protein